MIPTWVAGECGSVPCASTYNASGTQTVTPGTRSALNGEAEVVVSVADQGTGIPKEKLKEIFDTF